MIPTSEPATSTAAADSSARPVSAIRPRALVLLAGAVRPRDLHRAAGRSLLDLPLEPELRLLDQWRLWAAALAATLGGQRLSVRVLVSQGSPLPAPRSGWEASGLELTAQHDPAAFRGTGGALRDICQDYAPDDWLLVASASQILVEPLETSLALMAAAGGEAVLLSSPDGSPCGLFLLRAGLLRELRPLGYVDLKEQALPELAARHPVMVVPRSRAQAVALRTAADYLRALRWWYRPKGVDEPPEGAAFAETWQSRFALVEDRAQVAGDARVLDSVVLAGAVVGPGATVVRSLLGPGARVSAGERVVEQVLPAGGR